MVFIKDDFNPHIHLNTLGFSEVPTPDGLRDQFTRLLKLYHPDRNLHCREWAHEQTMKIIESHKWLRSYLEKNKSSTDEMDDSDEYDFDFDSIRSSESPKPKIKSEEVPFQLVESKHGNFAIPIENIVMIVDPQSLQNSTSGNTFYFSRDGENYELISLLNTSILETNSNPMYIILFRAETANYAIPVFEFMKFGSIKEFFRNECIYVASHETYETGWLMACNDQKYLFPERLLRAMPALLEAIHYNHSASTAGRV